jgi:alpha-D-ribose 1-methylphosphonate 5-triphosphate synthase subunit PhnI
MTKPTAVHAHKIIAGFGELFSKECIPSAIIPIAIVEEYNAFSFLQQAWKSEVSYFQFFPLSLDFQLNRINFRELDSLIVDVFPLKDSLLFSDLLANEGLLKPINPKEDRKLVDITREAIKFPAPRSARLQMLSRAETGGLMAMGYSSMRGFGSVHPTVGELRYGQVPVKLKDPSGRIRYIGKIEVTEAEMIASTSVSKKTELPSYTVGYGLCFGQNDTKVICMGILDTTMRNPDASMPANDQEFVLYHTEGIESMGFTNHLKLPHYVTFQSGLKNIREAIERKTATQTSPSKAE